MPINQESLQDELYDFLKSQGYRPTRFDSSGKKVPLSKLADVFKFDFKMDDTIYGEVYAAIIGRNLVLFNGDDVLDSPNVSKTGDMSFNKMAVYLKGWAHDHQLGFERDDIENLEDEMAKREETKKLDESYHPHGKKASYNDSVPNVKIKIQHSRAIEEGEQRYRNVARIYLENQDGERFLLNTKKPGIARVYARHIAEGGKVNDDRWGHIDSLVEEYTKMAGFVRATRNGQFNESTQELVSEGINHYTSLRETLHKLSGKRGYNKYFESYTPTLQEDMGIGQPDLAEMFISSTLDPRIENAMPILAKLMKPKKHRMDEVSELEEWSESVINEKLKPHKVDQIRDLAKQFEDEIPYGDDAVNVKNLLSHYDLEDHDLFSFLKAVSDADRDADARPAVMHWLSQSKDHDIHRLLQAIQEVMPKPQPAPQPVPQQAAPEPAPAPAPQQQAAPQQPVAEDELDEDLPPPENARKTQIASTLGTYKKARAMLDKEGAQGKSLDFGAGLGKGTPELGDDAESYEPFPREDFKPHYVDATKIPSNSYNRIVNLNVLNVVPNVEGHRIRDQIVKQIGRVLAPGGVALITTRGRDVLTIKGTPGEEPMSMISSIGTYQKGFSGTELREYIQDVLGDNFTVSIIKLGPAGVMIKKHAETQDVEESLRQGERHHFETDPETGKRVYKGIRGDQQNTPKKRGDDDSAADRARRDRQAHIKHDRGLTEEEVEEGLDKNQKRAGQLGPTEKVKNNNIGKLVGASESVDPLIRMRKLSGLN